VRGRGAWVGRRRRRELEVLLVVRGRSAWVPPAWGG
jgi:hypothetical protein